MDLRVALAVACVASVAIAVACVAVAVPGCHRVADVVDAGPSPPFVDAGTRPKVGGVPPDRLSCNCLDGTVLTACEAACSAGNDDDTKCNAGCATHNGLREARCFPHDLFCGLGAAEGGDTGIVCPCPGQDDVGRCSSLDCAADADVIAALCADSCGVSLVDAPICIPNDPGCASDGAVSGRDGLACFCADGSIHHHCTAGVCVDNGATFQICNGDCGGAGKVNGFNCTPRTLDCVLGGVAGGSTSVDCSCNGFDAAAVCTTLDCDADATRINTACDVACAALQTTAAEARCTANNAGCTTGDHVPDGATYVDCHCLRKAGGVRRCIDGCTDLCTTACDGNYGGGGCTSHELTCALGNRGAGPNGFVCNCASGFDNDGACTTLDCNTDAATIAGLCDDWCGPSGTLGSPVCNNGDVGCLDTHAFPAGPLAVDCNCRHGADVRFCANTDGHDQRILDFCEDSCEPLDGGFNNVQLSVDGGCP